MPAKHRRPGPLALALQLARLTDLDWILITTLAIALTRAATPRDQATGPKIPWPDLRLRRETGELPGPDPALPYDPDLPVDSYRDVQGYDCNRMTGAEAVQLPPPGECPRNPVHVKKSENATFLVLQEANFVQVTAKRCTGMNSRLPTYCGAYDHETVLSEYMEIDRRDPVAASDCRRIWDEHKVRLGHREYDIKPNTTFQRAWNAAGRHLYGDPNHIRCQGQTIHDPRANHVVDTRYTTITTNVEPMALAPDGRLISTRRQVALPCNFGRRSCVTPSGTYIWEDLSEDQKCKLFQVRKTSGQVHTDADGEETYVSTDGSALRFLIGAPTMRCDRMVLKTEHERVFLTREEDEPMFARELAPQERSPLLYANVQDGYLETKLGSKLDQVISVIKQESCRTRATHSIGRYDQIAAVQRSTADGETASLGHGVFATASGEAWWRYRCRAVVARAMDLPECYTALPVTLLFSDVQAHFEAAGRPIPENYQFFLEPHSHRLVTTAARKDCASKLAPLFRTAHGRWVHATPKVGLAEAPHRLNALQVLPDDASIGQTNYAKGGLYTEEDVAEMDQFRMLPNVVQEIEVTMGQRAIRRGWTASTHDELRTRDVLQTHGPWYLDPFGALWGVAEEVGDVGFTLWGIMIVGKMLTWIVGLLLRWFYGPAEINLSPWRRILVLFLPSAAHYFNRRFGNQAANPGTARPANPAGAAAGNFEMTNMAGRDLPQPPADIETGHRDPSPPPGYRTRRPSHALLVQTPQRLRRAAVNLWDRHRSRSRARSRTRRGCPEDSSDGELTATSTHQAALDALVEGKRNAPTAYANAEGPESDTDAEGGRRDGR